VVLLGPDARGAPLEEPDRVRAVGDMREAVAHQLARSLGGVHRLPVHGARGVLHEHPGPPPGEAARQVPAEGELGGDILVPGDAVVVRAHDILLGGPPVIVEPAEVGQGHEVRGDGHTGREPVQDIPLGDVLGKERVGLETPVVQHLRGVAEGRGMPGRQDVLPVDVALAPERRAPTR
jgi:hypothetical protein